ncbi:MAG TPA: MSMEG_1061 family FMN-dependent PPOX-type flavoprotein [Pseudolabrys sp.]|jgi:PPOX class probable FMN-dependent enzyme|nr:MSMEG_1061 family FMN-dependent PPOX-type flavoprotein [Pseudolabrys sp.]
MSTTEYVVGNVVELERLYDSPAWAALAKETDRLIAPYRAFVEAAPFLTLATTGPDGPDCSPRGDAPGFVRVVDPKTLLIPNRDGNNRIESLRNIVCDPRVAIHFLVPGCGESLRVKGRASISTDPALTTSFALNSKSPRTVIVVAVERAYFHCAKAIHRSRLWDVSQQVDRQKLPGPNAMLAAIQWQRCRDVIRIGRPKPVVSASGSETAIGQCGNLPDES